MEIIITQWAFDSYLRLKHGNFISTNDYRQTIRPDVERLRRYPKDPKFKNSKFWSQATETSKGPVRDGFKMKWHNVGNGKIQLRLPVGLLGDAYLGAAYVKANSKAEQRNLAKFKTHLELIRQGKFIERGRLS